MTRIINISDSSQWESIYSYSATAVLDGDVPIPLPPFSVPVFLESDIIAIYCNTNVPSGKKWVWGGSAEQIFNVNLIPNIQSTGEPKNLYINRLTTIFFPSVTASYSLKVRIPRWFYNCYYEFWRYIGDDISSEQKLMIEEFSNLNFKIDQLMNQ